MSIEADFVTYTLASSVLTTSIGTRLYPEGAEPDAPTADKYPFVIYRKTGGAREYYMQGQAGTQEFNVQCEVHSNSYSECIQVADELRDRWSGYRGAIGSSHCRACFLENERDAGIPRQDGSQSRVYIRLVDFVIHYNETDATGQ